MKSYKDLFIKTERCIRLYERDVPVSVLRIEYEDEVLGKVYGDELRHAHSAMSLDEQLASCSYHDAFTCGLLNKASLYDDFPIISPEIVKKSWRYSSNIDKALIDSVLVSRDELLLGLYVCGSILWLGGEIEYSTMIYTSGDNNGAGYKGEGYYEGKKYLAMLYNPGIIFKDTVFASRRDTDVKELTVPAGTVLIDSSAFERWTLLERVILPEGLLEISANAFRGCSALKEIKLPKSLKKIGSGAFAVCTSLEEIDLSYVSELGGSTFDGCKNLTRVIFPDGKNVKIGSWEFHECERLTEIVNSESISYFSEYAFAGCKSLREFKISESLRSIHTSAFSGCESLVEMHVPQNATSIGTYAFSHCKSLRTLTLPKELWNISTDAFLECTALDSVTLPRDMQENFEDAMGDDDTLEKIKYTFI